MIIAKCPWIWIPKKKHREHYLHLLNVKLPWNPDNFPEMDAVESLSQPVRIVRKAINKRSFEKAAGPSGIVD